MVSHDENHVKAERDKLLKYLDLAREVVNMWEGKYSSHCASYWLNSQQVPPTSKEALVGQLDS